MSRRESDAGYAPVGRERGAEEDGPGPPLGAAKPEALLLVLKQEERGVTAWRGLPPGKKRARRHRW